jgi:hypothetical protein
MIPPVTAIPATITIPAESILQPTTREVPEFGTVSKVSISNWKNSAPQTSPDLRATTAPRLIAQSELPGSNPQIPPSPSIKDTGSGYPTRIPHNYFGPAFATGNGSGSFGVISRFQIGDNYSIRPSAVFGGNGTILRVPVTYDFVFSDREPFERNPVVTFHAGGGIQYASGSTVGDKFSLLGTVGVDVNLFEGIALVASYNTDFSSINGVNFGLGFEF